MFINNMMHYDFFEYYYTTEIKKRSFTKILITRLGK